MIDFEKFIEEVHGDLSQHASITNHYIELNCPQWKQIGKICTAGFWNSLGLDPHRLTEYDRKQQLEKLSFSSAMAKFAQHPPLNDDTNELIHMLIRGLPSAGKTVALSRIGAEAIKSVSDDRVIHFCTMQYYTGREVRIRSWTDLWNIIIQCHVNDKVAQQGMTIEEFSELHSNQGRKPTMLIDTLDLLTYGVDPKRHSMISDAWSELLKEFKKHDIFAIWTCRTHEFEMLAGPETNVDKSSFQVIDLPTLNHSNVRGLVERRKADYNLTPKTANSLRFLVHAFPITIKFLQQDQRFRPSKRFIQHFNKSINTMRYSRGHSAVHPFVWVMNQQNGLLSIDGMYRFIKEEIINLMVRDIEIKGDSAKGKEILNDKWSQLIEGRFHRQSVSIKARFGTRLSIPRSLDVERFEQDTANSLALNDQEILDLFVHFGELFGLFNRHPTQLIFSHQLFSEYCVWYVAKAGNSTDEAMIRLNELYPSIMLRTAEIQPQNPSLNQYEKWIFPLIVGSNLHLQSRSVVARGAHKKHWERMWKYSRKANGTNEGNNIKKIVFDPFTDLTDHQSKIARELPLKHPLFLDAPPGTGKTFIAANFIHRMSEMLEWDIQENKASVMFLTMSPFLREQFVKRIDEHFTRNGIVDEARHGIQLNSMAVADLLFSLQRNVLGKTDIDEVSFHRSLLTKSMFQKGFGKHQKFTRLKKKYNLHALWHEFLSRVHKKDGSLCPTVADYIETNTKSGAINTLFHRTNIGVKGDSGRGNTERANEEAKVFFDILKDCGYLSTDSGFATISKRCEETILELLKQSSLGKNQNDQFWERLIPFLSDITVIDEVQDLNFSMLKLAMILHRGKLNGFYFSGDDEQTLSWEPFDWEDNFGKAVELIRELRETFPNSRIVKECVGSWWDDTLHRHARPAKRRHLTIVERNLPNIVDFIRDSFKTSVTTIARGRSKDHGTANIVQSPRMEKKLGELNQSDIRSGVYQVQEPIGKDEILHLGRILFETPNAPALVLPNHNSENEVRRWFQAEEDSIKIPLWNPVSIKGLEFESVIAISPWSADQDMLVESLGEDFKPNASPEQNDQVAEKKQGAYLNVYERMMHQLIRHSNVVLSRPQYKLIVCEASEDSLNLYSTRKPQPVLNNEIETLFMNEMLDDIQDPNQNFTDSRIHESNDDGNLSSFVHMIKKFVDLIKTENSLMNSLYQGAHLRNLMEQGSGPENTRGGPPQKPLLWNTRAPFLVVAVALDKFDDLGLMEEVGGRSHELSVQLRRTVVNDLIRRIQIQKMFPKDAHLTRMVNKLCRMPLRVNKKGKNHRVVHYSPGVYDGFKQLYNELVTLLASPPSWSENVDSKTHLGKDDRLVFMSFVANNLLGGKLDTSTVESWSSVLRDFDFRDMQIKSEEGKSGIPGVEVMIALEQIAGNQNEEDDTYWNTLESVHHEDNVFWRDGMKILPRFSQQELDVLWFDIEPKFDGQPWSMQGEAQTRCMLSMVCMLHRKSTTKPAPRAAQLLRRVAILAFHESDQIAERVPIKEVLLKSKSTPLELDILGVKLIQMLADSTDNALALHEAVNRNNFMIKELHPTASMNDDVVRDVYEHSPEFFNGLLRVLVQFGMSETRSFLQSWFVKRASNPIQTIVGELREWIDVDGDFGSLDLMYSNEFGLFADLEQADTFFTAHRSLAGGLLDEFMLRLYAYAKYGRCAPIVGIDGNSKIGGSNIKDLLQSETFDFALFLSRVYNCSIQTDGIRPKIEFHRAAFEPIPEGLELVDFLYERKSKLYEFENTFLENLGYLLSPKQGELATFVKENTQSTKVFWMKEARKLLGLKPHELKNEINNKKGRTTVNLNFLMEGNKIRFNAKDINKDNNIVLDAVINRGLRSVLMPRASKNEATDGPNFVRMAFFDRCDELWEGGQEPKDRPKFTKDFEYYTRFGVRLNSPQMMLSDFVILNEFLRTLKQTLFFHVFELHDDDVFTDDERIFCITLDALFSFSNLVQATQDTIHGLSKRQDSTKVSTVLKNTIKTLLKQALSSADDIDSYAVAIKAPYDVEGCFSDINALVKGLASNIDVMYAYQQIVTALTPNRKPETAAGGEATVDIVFDEARQIELDRRLEELCETDLIDATRTEWLVNHTDADVEALMNGSRTSVWRCKSKETYDDF